MGAILGAAFGVWNLVETWLDPLADDTIAALLLFYGPMFAAWGVAGFVFARRSGRVLDAITAGATIALVSFIVFALANLIRVNLFLDSILNRADWENMRMRFQGSGFSSFRAFVAYHFVMDLPLKISVASIIGAFVGLVGGLLTMIHRRQSQGMLSALLVLYLYEFLGLR